jgi:MYXO-CTERM domain-containing protein
VLDQGETGTIMVAVRNAGKADLTGVSAKVTVTSGHDVTLENDGVITFDTLNPFKNTVSAPLKLTLNQAGIADEVTFEVTFPGQDELSGGASLSAATIVNYDFELTANDGLTAMANMEGFNGKADFREHVMTGGEMAVGTQSFTSQYLNLFRAYNPSVDFGAQTMFLANNGFQTDIGFETGTFEVGFSGNFIMSFWHLYLLEADWDGGVVEVSLNGGNWIDVTEAGGQFKFGYNTEKLEENPSQALQDRPVFSGGNYDPANGRVGDMEEIHFGSALDGQSVRFRFRLSSDGGAQELGWFIDNVKFNNVVSPVFHKTIAGNVNACDNVAPMVSVPESVATTESASVAIEAVATDRNGDALTYSWVQVDGPAATLTGADTATLNVTSPSITADTALKFELTVSDGKTMVKSMTVVNVTNETPPPIVVPPTEKKSSSGSLGWFAMLMAAAGLIRRRR